NYFRRGRPRRSNNHRRQAYLVINYCMPFYRSFKMKRAQIKNAGQTHSTDSASTCPSRVRSAYQNNGHRTFGQSIFTNPLNRKEKIIIRSIRKRNVFKLRKYLLDLTIITLLISILLTALAAARNAARTSQYASNMRQIVMSGESINSLDHNGHIVPPYMGK